MGLDLFVCEKRTLTLSTIGCSRLYQSANGAKPPAPYEGRAACVACPIGAFHFTGRPQNPIDLLTEALRMLCPRCGRPAAELINGTLCRSCHARHLEAIAGKNAKGHPPALSARLHIQRLAVSAAATVPRTITFRAVASMAEAIIHHTKHVSTPTAFGRRRLQWAGVRQLEFAL